MIQLTDVYARHSTVITARPQVVIIEDEPLIALTIEERAGEIGWDVALIAHSDPTALALLYSGSKRLKAVAVLDITGCSTSGVPTGGGTHPVLPKPSSPVDFKAARA